MSINVELLDRAVAWAEREDAKRLAGEPSEWDQNSWGRVGLDCGTTCCVAGHIALAELGGKPELDDEERYNLKHEGFAGFDEVRLPSGVVCRVERAAQVALGLDYDQADALFRARNDIEDLRAVADALKVGTSPWAAIK